MITHDSAAACLLVFIFWVFGVKCAATDTSELEKLLGEAVLLALEHARIVVKDACAVMHIDEAHFRRGLRADEGSHLSLTRLIRLPFTFWLHFSPALIYLVAKKHTSDIWDDLGMRRGG